MTQVCPQFLLVESYGKIPVYMLAFPIITLCNNNGWNSLHKNCFIIKFIIINNIKIFCHVKIRITPSKPWYMQNFTMVCGNKPLGFITSNHGKILHIPFWFVMYYSYNSLNGGSNFGGTSYMLCMFWYLKNETLAVVKHCL